MWKALSTETGGVTYWVRAKAPPGSHDVGAGTSTVNRGVAEQILLQCFPQIPAISPHGPMKGFLTILMAFRVGGGHFLLGCSSGVKWSLESVTGQQKDITGHADSQDVY